MMRTTGAHRRRIYRIDSRALFVNAWRMCGARRDVQESALSVFPSLEALVRVCDHRMIDGVASQHARYSEGAY